ncbi:hypothetical protein [Smaragdicoccus niigatensis]|uniref:hypothetical protein n=1 Tax=Smaragdicoccus niigatensis TaxID=359359 RepID=UPI0003769FF1|nr:hypothetical protein [Smaragdicoccus niigatensis]
MPDDRELTDSVATSTPNTIKVAGGLVALEGVVGVVLALVLVIRAAFGADQTIANGVAEAVWFIILGGGVAAAGVALFLGHRWGRSIAVVSQIVMLPVAWMVISSQQLLYGIPLALAAVATLVLVFLPSSTRWAAEIY